MKFGKFIEEYHAPMCKGYFTGTRPAPTPDNGDSRSRMVWVAKRALYHKSRIAQESANTVYFCDLNSLVVCHGRHNSRNSTGKQCLAGPGRAMHQYIMPTACRNQKCPLGLFLALNIRHID